MLIRLLKNQIAIMKALQTLRTYTEQFDFEDEIRATEGTIGISQEEN